MIVIYSKYNIKINDNYIVIMPYIHHNCLLYHVIHYKYNSDNIYNGKYIIIIK